MNLQDFVKLLRTRWITIAATAIVTLMAAVIITLMTTPLYETSTRLFVSASDGATLAETYQGNRFSQERVLSYTELLMGRTLAERTIEKLDLDLSADQLQDRVKASAKPDTVLIDVAVVDESPVQARDIANTLSDEFVAMVRELETPEDGTAPDSRVVVEQRAAIPESPVAPQPARNLAIGLGLGLLLGIGVAMLRDMLDNTVKDREILEEITGTGTVGTIPLDKDRRQHPSIAFDSDNSAIAEAFRKLRTNLQFLTVDNPPRMIVVTSSIPSEGKSTTAINTALALAEAGNRVVIVDGDLRRPALHKYLDLVGTVGFSTVLSGAVQLDEALQVSRFPGLSVLTAGTIPPNPSELLGSQSTKKLLAELRAEFDYVIVDSTPLLAVTDAAILATSADGALMITRYGSTKRDQLAYAVSSLQGVGAPLLGTVLTMTPARGSASYSYSYYGEAGNQQTVKPTRIKRNRPKDAHAANPSEVPGVPADTSQKS